MIDKKLIKKVAERYGVGYREVPLGEGGCIVDKTRKVKKNTALEMAQEMFGQRVSVYEYDCISLYAA